MPSLQSPFPVSIDRRLRIFGPIVLFTTGMLFFKLKLYLELKQALLYKQVIVALFCGYIGWQITRYIVLYIQYRLPGLSRTSYRVAWMAVTLVLLSPFLVFLRVGIHMALGKAHWPTLIDYSDTMGVLLFYTTIILGIYETAYLVQQWKQTAIEKEVLLQSEWQAKYDLLKAQINPHFLFNSLNSLSVLITEDPKKAEEFANQLSRMYRYVLKTSETGHSTLEEELKFIRTYANLLNVRYGDGLNLFIDVDDADLEYQLPSLTLQLLVENAVKHNSILKDAPLLVTIKTNGKRQVVVENNIQKKRTFVPSTGMGIKNINEKYRLLNSEGLTIDDDGSRFKVSVPLIFID